jgi:hypothetical protein
MASPHEKKEFESWYRALITVVAPSADRRDLPHAGIQVKRGKPISLLIIRKANREVIGLAM